MGHLIAGIGTHEFISVAQLSKIGAARKIQRYHLFAGTPLLQLSRWPDFGPHMSSNDKKRRRNPPIHRTHRPSLCGTKIETLNWRYRIRPWCPDTDLVRRVRLKFLISIQLAVVTEAVAKYPNSKDKSALALSCICRSMAIR